jgi:hypothetical protein
MSTASIFGLTAVLPGGFRRRREFIGFYAFPTSVYATVRKLHPELSAADCNDVVELLREWFLLCLAARRKFLSMPSQIVDDAWHAFIIDTRAYADFCRQAFGRFLHHTPAQAMATPTSGSRGLRRTWRAALFHEGQDLERPQRLPRLFAVDERLKVRNGFRYQLDCSRNGGVGGWFGMHLGGGGCGAGGCGSDTGGSSGSGGGWFGGESWSGGESSSGSSCGGGCGGD